MGSGITEINKDTFWQLIEETKNQCGQDMDASISWIKKELLSMPPEQSLQFHAIMHGYRDLADKYGLWTAAIFIKEYGCSDDGFMDFRAWLIAQGKDIYMAALENPDSLPRVEQYGDCEFELLNYVGDYAYQELTGRSAYGWKAGGVWSIIDSVGISKRHFYDHCWCFCRISGINI